jgi:hypothetical protein
MISFEGSLTPFEGKYDRSRRLAFLANKWLLHTRDRSLNFDQKQSRAYLQADIALADGGAPPGQAGRWVTKMLELETYIRIAGGVPRQNTRRPDSTSAEVRSLADWSRPNSRSAEVRSLAEWFRRQRRAAREGRLCTYQRHRFEEVWTALNEPYIDFAWENRYAPFHVAQ